MTVRMRRIVVTAACAAGVAGCGGGGDGDEPSARAKSAAPRTQPATQPEPAPAPGPASGSARPLRLRAVPTPRLDAPRYDTTGTVPQVAGAPRLGRVNAGLLDMVRRDQARYGRRARREVASRPDLPYRGTYRTWRPDHVSASTTVVSVLVPLLALYPGGNDGSGWLSATLRVPSGERVPLTGLFADARAGLRAVAAATRRHFDVDDSSQARCVRRSLADPTVGDLNERGLRPRPRNYDDYALMPGGLALGFHQAQFSAPPCSSIAIVIPYSAIRPHLGSLGRRLVAGVRRPR